MRTMPLRADKSGHEPGSCPACLPGNPSLSIPRQKRGGYKKEAALSGGFVKCFRTFAYFRRRKMSSAAAPKPAIAIEAGSGTTK
jgi:hypothetical protein